MVETLTFVKGVPKGYTQLNGKVLMFGIQDAKYFIDSHWALEDIQVQYR